MPEAAAAESDLSGAQRAEIAVDTDVEVEIEVIEPTRQLDGLCDHRHQMAQHVRSALSYCIC